MDNKLSIHFGEDKTKTILFSSKNRSKNVDKIEIRRHDIIIKQFDIVPRLSLGLYSFRGTNGLKSSR